MKSVIIRDKKGEILIKIIHRKNGIFDITRRSDLVNADIEVRDDNNRKVVLAPAVPFSAIGQ